MKHQNTFFSGRRAACLLLALLLAVLPGAAPAAKDAETPVYHPETDACGLRGFDSDSGYQYVIMGWYPYEADGTPAPVLWQVLGVEEGKALLLSTYIIDAHQPVEVSDREIAEKKKYRAIADYGETDLNTWLNDVMIYDLLGDEPVFAAVTEEQYGRLYPLTDREMMQTRYGFSEFRYYVQRSRWAFATPYALNKKLYPEVKGYFNRVTKDQKYGTSSYWVAAIKPPQKEGEPGRYLQLCAGILESNGDNRIGHLSYGFLSRTTVGLRVALRLDTSRIQVVSGTGSIYNPCRLALVNAETQSVETPPLRPEPTPAPTTPVPDNGKKHSLTEGPEGTPVPVPEWVNRT